MPALSSWLAPNGGLRLAGIGTLRQTDVVVSIASQSFRIPIVADSAATVFGKLINRALEHGLARRAPDFTTPMH